MLPQRKATKPHLVFESHKKCTAKFWVGQETIQFYLWQPVRTAIFNDVFQSLSARKLSIYTHIITTYMKEEDDQFLPVKD